MRCPKCQFEILEGAKFCNECGSKLEITCSACGKKNPLNSKFCIECGHKITISFPEQPSKRLSFDEKLAKIQL
jgi:rRNA maturation endonuclease Nob1